MWQVAPTEQGSQDRGFRGASDAQGVPAWAPPARLRSRPLAAEGGRPATAQQQREAGLPPDSAYRQLRTLGLCHLNLPFSPLLLPACPFTLCGPTQPLFPAELITESENKGADLDELHSFTDFDS